MVWQRLNRTDPEKVFVLFQNVTGGATVAGDVTQIDVATFDGIRAAKPTTANLSAVLGCWAAAYADSAYGFVQAYGINSDVKAINHTSVAIAAGDILIAVNGATYFARNATASGISGFAYAGATVATGSATLVASGGVFLRCL